MCFTTCENYPRVYTLQFGNPEFLLLKNNNFNTKLYLTKLRFGALQGQMVEEPVLVIRQGASKLQATIQPFQAVQSRPQPSRAFQIRSRAASRTPSNVVQSFASAHPEPIQSFPDTPRTVQNRFQSFRTPSKTIQSRPETCGARPEPPLTCQNKLELFT